MVNDELDALLEAAKQGLSSPVEHVTIQPGMVAWDTACGMLYARVANTQPTLTRGPCGVAFYTVNVAVGVLRCVATLDSGGKPPSAEAITDDGHQTVTDMTDLARVLACYKPEHAEEAQLGQWTPLGPQGGMAGGEWAIGLQFVSL